MQFLTSSDENKSIKYQINQPNPTIGKQDLGDKTNPVYNDTVIVESSYVQQLKGSLHDFVQKVEAEAQNERIPTAEVTTFKAKVNELEDETKDLNQGLTEQKKRTIRERLKSVAVALVKISPKIARTIIGFTPLAPFSNLVGESFENMVNSALNG